MQSLRNFFHDKAARQEWSKFVKAVLDEEALKDVYLGNDTQHYKKAHEIINKAQDALDALFQEQKRPVQGNRGV